MGFLGSFIHYGWIWFVIGLGLWPVLKRIPDGLIFIWILIELALGD